MSRIKSRLTVFFEEPFWVGVFEQETDGVICAARVVFGAQPTDAKVFEFVLRHADRLRYGPPVEGRLSRENRVKRHRYPEMFSYQRFSEKKKKYNNMARIPQPVIVPFLFYIHIVEKS